MDEISTNLEEVLEILGFGNQDGEFVDNYFVIDLLDYDEFNNIYNELEKNINMERDSDSSSLDAEDAHVTYVYKNMLLELVAIFDDDEYTLNIFEGEED